MSEIVIENVCKTFQSKDGTVNALKNVNLTIEAGDIYGIIGMSGAGKSTLVRCMNFLEVPTTGRVLVRGRALGDLTQRELRKQREEIGMIFQHFNLLMQKNVLENVCFPLYIQKKSKETARKRAAELLEIVGLKDKMHAGIRSEDSALRRSHQRTGSPDNLFDSGAFTGYQPPVWHYHCDHYPPDGGGTGDLYQSGHYAGGRSGRGRRRGGDFQPSQVSGGQRADSFRWRTRWRKS